MEQSTLQKIPCSEKKKCRISGKIGMYIMPEEFSIQIDSKYDITKAELTLKIMKKK